MFSQPSAAAALTLVWAENASQDLLSVFSSWLHSVRCWGVALFCGRPRTPLGGSPSYLTLNSGFGYSWVCWRSMKIRGRWKHLVRVVEVFGVLIYQPTCGRNTFAMNLSGVLFPHPWQSLLSPSVSPRMNTAMISSLILWTHLFLDINYHILIFCTLISLNLF